MTLAYILVSLVLAAFLGLVMRNRWRQPLLLVVSALAVYALQPALPVRFLDFWLPTATLGLAVLGWIVTTPPEGRDWRANWPAAALLAGVALVLGLTRSLGLDLALTASRPPQFLPVLAAVGILAGLTFLLSRFTKPGKIILASAFLLVLLFFVFLKVPSLSILVSVWIRSLNNQSTDLASVFDIRWLGFSYIAFRLLHTFRDRQAGRLPQVALGEYVVYVIFFPALSAGPIDRIERFVADLRRPLAPTADDLRDAGKRLALGLFKKFVLADALALIALNATNALQVRAAGWAWVLLYAYSFQLYFDFSGYTDIAIGLGRLLGFKLPENFNAPYCKLNLTQFWNNWHMTLTQWLRAYGFNPLTRSLRSWKKPLPIPVIILLTQLVTMVLIGLWHGVSWNFTLWGLWHALGLFVHNRWSAWTKSRFAALPLRWQSVLNVGGALLTFHYVTLGWVFFALPDLSTSWQVFLKLFGGAA
jgi:D-alanyl-lipoteichoic acid acyltransferase DltB (MBOAT superfamily)